MPLHDWCPPISSLMPHALVIDDEPTIRSTLSRFFQREGWEVTTCADAAEAMAVVTGPDCPPFLLVLCDARLPGLSGAGFYRSLVEVAPALAERLVVITGDPFGADVPSLPDRPIPMLEKPFEFELLRQLMRERVAKADS